MFASFGTAYAGGTPKKIKKGVIKKPPPTPKRPDKIPTTRLRVNIKGKRPHYMKYGNIWHFTGFPIEMREKVMGYTWEKENG